MTHPRLSGNSEPVTPDVMVAQRPSYALHPIMQSQNSHCQRMQGLPQSWGVEDLLNPLNLTHSQREQTCSHSQLPVGLLPWQFEAQSL